MLAIKISHTQWTIPLKKVHYIDYTDVIISLPFAISPIEGLTIFNNKPLIQVNLAQTLGFGERSGNKRVIITTPQGKVALRVDEVLEFVRQDSSGKLPPLLELTEILTWLKTGDAVQEEQIVTTHSNLPTTVPSLTVLLVVAGGRTVALLSNSIDHIDEIDNFQLLDYENTQPDLLIKVNDSLLPAYSLARFLDCGAENSKLKAVIMRGSRGHWALVVEQFLELENVSQVYTAGTDTQALWYIAKTGEIREIIDANQLIADSCETDRVPTTQPQWAKSFIQRVEQLSIDGLHINCGTSSFVLPITIAQRTIDQLNRSSMTRQRFPTQTRAHRKTRIPWINGTLLLSNTRTTTPPKHTILVTFPQQRQILLGVDHVRLQPTLTVEDWLPLVNLPYPTALFFDAVTYDKKTGQWVLRIMTHIEFIKLPWTIKKAFVAATIGWFDLETIAVEQEKT